MDYDVEVLNAERDQRDWGKR